MTLFEAIMIAISISLDAFVVAFSIGTCYQSIDQFSKYRFLIIVGLFHIIMPLIGFALTRGVVDFVGEIGGWIAFVILVYLGGKMIFDSFKNREQSCETKLSFDYLALKSTLYFALALSIDAIMVGFSMGVQRLNIIEASQAVNMLFMAIISGLSAFFIPLLGFKLGKSAINRSGNRAMIVGGIALIAIGLKTLLNNI